jgi:hypothetical protein
MLREFPQPPYVSRAGIIRFKGRKYSNLVRLGRQTLDDQPEAILGEERPLKCF